MNAKQFDKLFDSGKSVRKYLKLAKAVRPGARQPTIKDRPAEKMKRAKA
jgi:hypothetical protein